MQLQQAVHHHAQSGSPLIERSLDNGFRVQRHDQFSGLFGELTPHLIQAAQLSFRQGHVVGLASSDGI